MNKKELTTAVAKKLGLPAVKARDLIAVVLDTVFDGAARDGRCLFRGHAFKLKKTKSRTVRDLNTGGIITVPEKFVVTYRKIVPATAQPKP